MIIKNMFTYKKNFRVLKDYVKSPFEKFKEIVMQINPVTIVSSGIFHLVVLLIAVLFIGTGIGMLLTIKHNPAPITPNYNVEKWLTTQHFYPSISFLKLIAYDSDKSIVAITGDKKYELEVFKNNDAKTVYLLDYKYYPLKEMNGVEVYRQILQKKLEDEGRTLKVIGIDDLKTLNNDSVVIVPTGYMPIEFAEGITHTIIFIGKDITKYYNQSSGSVDETKKPLVNKLDERVAAQGLKLRQSEFLVGGGETYHNVVSVVKMDKGTLIVIPASLEAWDCVEDAVDDTLKIIDEHIWSEDIGTVKTKPNELSFSSAFKDKTVALLLKDMENGKIVYGGKMILANFDYIKNDMPYILPMGMKDRDIYFTIHINSPYSPINDQYVYEVYDSKNNKLTEKTGTVSLAGERDRQFKIDNTFLPGDYILKLVRKSGSVSIPTATIGFHVVQPVIKGSDKFEANPYRVEVLCDRDCKYFEYNRVTIYLDNKKIGNYPYQNLLAINIYPSGGKHQLIFDFGKGIKATKEITVVTKSLIDYLLDPLYFGMIILAIFIVAIGIQLRRKEKPIYYLDIPDFPPLSRITVPIKRSVILSLFDQINKDYGWHYLPIKTEELQSALLRLSYKGRPLSVSIHTIEKILDLLSSEGYVKSYDEYYGLSRWEEELGIKFKTLALLRKLRDILINNVVRFEPFNKVKNADTKIYLGGDEYYVLLYKDPKETILRSIGPLKDKNIIILFENEFEKQNFVDSLYSHDNEILIFKLELNSDRITLMTFEEFEKFIKKFKK